LLNGSDGNRWIMIVKAYIQKAVINLTDKKIKTKNIIKDVYNIYGLSLVRSM